MSNQKFRPILALLATMVLATIVLDARDKPASTLPSPSTTQPGMLALASPPALPVALGLEAIATIPGAVFLTAPPNDARQFIVQREGRIFVRENGVVLDTPFLDINGSVLSQKEGGLLSMAFHPDYASNGYFFLFYTDKLHRTVIERRRVSAD